MVDTNSNPDEVEFPIPGNDDSAKAIEVIVKHITSAIEEGLGERKKDKDSKGEGEEAKAEVEEAAEEKA